MNEFSDVIDLDPLTGWMTDQGLGTGPIDGFNAAIVDWELCTIGDPLLDLGWLMAMWHDPEEKVLNDQRATKSILADALHAHTLDLFNRALKMIGEANG